MTYLDLSFSEQVGLGVILYNFLHLSMLFKSPALIQGSHRSFFPLILHVISGTEPVDLFDKFSMYIIEGGVEIIINNQPLEVCVV